jgi:hypothetical protein
MIRRLRNPPHRPGLIDRVDGTLMRWFPPIANWCRYAIITLKKPAS